MARRRMSGEGSIYRRKSDGRWVATISRGPRGANQVQTVYRRSRADARTALDELRAQFGPINAKTETVSSFLGRWARDARNIRETTRHGYQAAIVTHITPTIGMVRLADLSPVHVESMLADLAPLMAPKTLRNVHIVLRRGLGQAVRAGLIVRNVAAREYIDTPRVELDEPDVLSRAEVAAIMAAITAHPLERHVVVALGTGLRQGEQLGLAWEDIGEGVLRVRKELARVGQAYQRLEPKTSRSKRTLPLSAAVVDALSKQREAVIALGYVPMSTGPVFINTSGGPLNGSWLTHRWYELLDTAGVRRRPWKILRATFGSRLFEAGVSDRTIADLLGHSRVHTTQRHYIASAGVDVTAALASVVADTNADTNGIGGLSRVEAAGVAN